MELDLDELKSFVNGVESLLLSLKAGDINSADMMRLRAVLMEDCAMLNELILDRKSTRLNSSH